MSFVVNAVKSVVNTVSNVVSGVVKAVGSIVSGVVKAVGSVVSSVVNFVLSPFLGLFGSPEVPSAATTESIKGVTVTNSGTDVSIPVVYGYRQIGGTKTFAETGSDNNKYLYVAYVLCEGPIEGVREVWVDDIQIGAANIPTLNGQTVVTISDTASGKLKGRVQLQLIKGSAGNVGSVVKAGIFAASPSWTTSMNYRGLAVLFARYEWINATDQATADAQPFSGNIPSIKVSVLGKKVTSLTSGTPENDVYGTDTQYFGQVYSMNPAEIILDYLRNAKFGKGLSNNDIDWDSFKKAAVKFNQQVTYTYSGTTGPVQTLHAVVDTGQTIFNNTKALLQNSRSYLPYSRNGTYKLKVEDAGNPTDILSGSAPIVATFTKDNIVGPITYQGIERTAKYNQVCITYTDPDQQWSAQQVYVPDTSSTEHATYLAEDGYRYNKGEFTFAWITNYAIAADMARLILMKSRNQDAITFTVTSAFMDLEVGDCVYIQSNILKFGTDPNNGAICWRIVSTKLNNDYTVNIGCVRNENYLYPYVKTTDRDYKLSVFVPKGATRYYPPEPAGIPVGLKPPIKAPTSPTDPTNPTDPTGGTGTVNAKLTDAITVFNTVVATDSNNNVYATLFFNRPNNSTITSVIFYYKQNITDSTLVWSTFERPIGALDAPNSDGSYSAKFGPLVNGPWIVQSRIKYSTGDLSSVLTTTTFNVGTTTGGTGGTGGVTPPGGGVVTPPANPANDYFKTVTGVTVTTGTYPNQIPKSIRQVTITCTQDVANGSNQFLNGIQVYYKPSAITKWYNKLIPVTVTPGTAITFTLDVGPRVYTLVPGTGGLPGNVDAYDFIFRFSYSDGKLSTWQWRAMGQVCEWSGLVYQFNLFVAGMTGGQTDAKVTFKEDAGAYVPQLIGPNDIVETRNIISPIYSIRDNGGAYNRTDPAVIFFFAPPVAADLVNWVGVRIYYHKAGQSGTGSYIDYTPVTYNNSGAVYTVTTTLNGTFTFDDIWEFVLVDLVYYGTGTVEANNGQYVYGYIHNRTGDADYPSDSNWIRQFIVGAHGALATQKAKLGSAQAKAIRNDTYFASISASTVLTGGVPSNPRKLSFTVKTSITNAANGHLAKVRIYYKFNSNVYWKYSDYPLTVENTNVTFDSSAMTPAMDLGARQYLTAPYLGDNYDFYFRIIYTDGTGSKFSPPFINVNIEDDGNNGTYSFNPFGNRLFQAGNLWTDLTLEENAPPGSVTKPTDITLTLTKIGDIGTGAASGQAGFYFNDPVASMLPYYGGIRIYRRDMTVGADNTFIVNDANEPIREFSGGGYGIAYQNINWDTVYSYLLVPMVWYQGALVEATNCLFWQGAIHNRSQQETGTNPYPGVNNLATLGNWLVKSSATTVNTVEAKASLGKPIVNTSPVVTITGMKYIVGMDLSTAYNEIKYVKPANTVSVTIYRRSIVARQTYAGKYYEPTNYWGAGRWEKIDVNDGGVANGSVVTVNLREATWANEFNYYYDPTKTAGVYNSSLGLTNWLYGNQSMSPPTNYFTLTSPGSTQLLFVVNYTSSGNTVASTQAIQLDCYYGVNYTFINGSATGVVNQNSYVVNLADFENITTIPATTNGVSLMRKVSEYRALIPLTGTNLVKPGTYSTTSWSYPSVTPTIV